MSLLTRPRRSTASSTDTDTDTDTDIFKPNPLDGVTSKVHVNRCVTLGCGMKIHAYTDTSTPRFLTHTHTHTHTHIQVSGLDRSAFIIFVLNNESMGSTLSSLIRVTPL